MNKQNTNSFDLCLFFSRNTILEGPFGGMYSDANSLRVRLSLHKHSYGHENGQIQHLLKRNKFSTKCNGILSTYA
jgi:hypothetical protein